MIVVAIGTVKLRDGRGRCPARHCFRAYQVLQTVESNDGEPYSAD